MSAPIAVTIAGLDPSCGAGIAADLKTFSALGVYGAAIVTALTAQNTKGVFGIHDVPPDFIAAQINAVFTDLAVGAVKIGMLGSPAAIDVVAAALDRYRPRNVVLDPVMIASSGQRLLRGDAPNRLRDLIARVHVLTPNLPEAAALLGTEPAHDEAQMQQQAQKLLAFGAGAVLIKGGHGQRRGKRRSSGRGEWRDSCGSQRGALPLKIPMAAAAPLHPPSLPASPRGCRFRPPRARPKLMSPPPLLPPIGSGSVAATGRCIISGVVVASEARGKLLPLEHDPEKWKPVFGQDHAQTKS